VAARRAAGWVGAPARPGRDPPDDAGRARDHRAEPRREHHEARPVVAEHVRPEDRRARARPGRRAHGSRRRRRVRDRLPDLGRRLLGPDAGDRRPAGRGRAGDGGALEVPARRRPDHLGSHRAAAVGRALGAPGGRPAGLRSHRAARRDVAATRGRAGRSGRPLLWARRSGVARGARPVAGEERRGLPDRRWQRGVRRASRRTGGAGAGVRRGGAGDGLPRDRTPSQLVAAGWWSAPDPSAVRRADAAFATAEVPWCGTYF